MCHPYIESDTALSDVYDEEITTIFGFCRPAEMDCQCLAGSINVAVDLKYDVLCCECLCTAYPLETGVTA